MGVVEETSPLLDARLRFPVHALPNERVVWAGTAHARAYRAMVVAVLLQFGLLLSAFGLLVASATLGEDCQVAIEQAGERRQYRDCTDVERHKDRQDRQAFRAVVAKTGLGILAMLVLVQLVANALRRRHLVYVVTNERVVVQDGYLGIRVDTIDLDHVVSITAKASLVEGWFGVKSVSVTVPGQKAAIWQRGVLLANAVELWGLPAQDPALSQLLNVWLPRQTT